MNAAPFVAVEWGTMRMRARLLTHDGATLARRETQVRLADLGRRTIVEMIAGLANAWSDGAAGGIIVSGMIGSAIGWTEVPRIACPAMPEAIARGTVRERIGDHVVTFVPGLVCENRFGDAEMMRGEEVAAIGVLSGLSTEQATLISVPGMHGKWVRLDGGAVCDFHTSMTVELQHAIAQATILAPLTRAPIDGSGDAFRAGVLRALEGGGLARLLFSARGAVQAGGMTTDDAAAYLWGLLIGADIRDGLAGAGGRHLVGGVPEVASLFVRALALCDVAAEMLDDEEVTAAGFCRLAGLLATRP